MIDWKDEANYPKELPLEGWAWEFLRRNQAYRKDYERWKALLPYIASNYPGQSLQMLIGRQADRKVTAYEPERGPEESFDQWQMRCIDKGIEPKTFPLDVWLGRKWHLKRLVDPEMPYSSNVKFRPPDFPHQVLWEDVEYYFSAPDDEAPQLPDPLRPLLAFDLQRPLQPQVDRAKTELERLAVQQGGAKKQAISKTQPVQWRRQLRVVDAVSANVKLKDIAAELFHHEDPDHGAKHVADIKEAALEMIESGYKRILAKCH